MLENWLFGHILWSNYLHATRSWMTKEKAKAGLRRFILGWWNQLLKPWSFCKSLVKASFGRVIWHKFPRAINQSRSPLLYSTLEKQLMASRQLIPSHNKTGKQGPAGQLKTHFMEHVLDCITVRWAHICLCLMSVSGPSYNYGDVTSAACLWGQERSQASWGVWYWIIGLQRNSWQFPLWLPQLYIGFVGQSHFVV